MGSSCHIGGRQPPNGFNRAAPWLPRDGETKVVAGLSETGVGSVAGHKRALGALAPKSARRATKDGKGPLHRRKAVLWGAGVGAVVLIGLVVALAGGGKSAPSSDNGYRPAYAAGPAPSPTTLKHAPGQVVFRLDAAKVPEFRATYDGFSFESGTASSLPLGVNPQCWKKGSRGEFVCGTYAGARALWVTNLTDDVSAQYAIELEADCACPLDAGQEYTIRIEYRTQGDPEAGIDVQNQKYERVAGAALAPSGDQWKTVTLKFRRPPGTPVRFTIGLLAGGANTSLYFRFVEVAR